MAWQISSPGKNPINNPIDQTGAAQMRQGRALTGEREFLPPDKENARLGYWIGNWRRTRPCNFLWASIDATSDLVRQNTLSNE